MSIFMLLALLGLNIKTTTQFVDRRYIYLPLLDNATIDMIIARTDIKVVIINFQLSTFCNQCSFKRNLNFNLSK